ncbi:MAG: hypothetical protein IJJ15_02570 [Ruminococcus sp.]|nr:hypothetical protein [Ruminococcus sp.]
MRFLYAAKGVKKIFSAEILSLIAKLAGGVVMALVIILGISANTENYESAGVTLIVMAICAIAALVLMIVGGIMNIVGYIQAAVDEPGFSRAVVCTIFSIIFYALGTLFQGLDGALSWVSSGSLVVSQILRLMVTIFAIGGLMNLSEKYNREDMVNKGRNILRVLCAIYAVSCVAIIMKEMFVDDATNMILVTILAISVVVLILIEYILYLSYLSKVKKVLNES